MVRKRRNGSGSVKDLRAALERAEKSRDERADAVEQARRSFDEETAELVARLGLGELDEAGYAEGRAAARGKVAEAEQALDDAGALVEGLRREGANAARAEGAERVGQVEQKLDAERRELEEARRRVEKLEARVAGRQAKLAEAKDESERVLSQFDEQVRQTRVHRESTIRARTMWAARQVDPARSAHVYDNTDYPVDPAAAVELGKWLREDERRRRAEGRRKLIENGVYADVPSPGDERSVFRWPGSRRPEPEQSVREGELRELTEEDFATEAG